MLVADRPEQEMRRYDGSNQSEPEPGRHRTTLSDGQARRQHSGGTVDAVLRMIYYGVCASSGTRPTRQRFSSTA